MVLHSELKLPWYRIHSEAHIRWWRKEQSGEGESHGCFSQEKWRERWENFDWSGFL